MVLSLRVRDRPSKAAGGGVDYTSTEYVLTFEDAAGRRQRAQEEPLMPIRAAAGARDRQESLVVGVGTSF